MTAEKLADTPQGCYIDEIKLLDKEEYAVIARTNE